MSAIALIPTDLKATRLGLVARLGDVLGDANVLEHTVRRAARVKRVEKIVLIHPPGQDPLSLIDVEKLGLGKPVTAQMDAGGLRDGMTDRWISSRKWAQPNWRGGLGGSTSYDELLPPAPLLDAFKAHGAEAALIVRCDWCLFDAELADRMFDLLYQDTEAMKMIFSQAPPGLSGVVVSGHILEQMCENPAGFGDVLAYSPVKPQIDPVGRDVNCPIPAGVRDTAERLVYDTPRSVAMIRAVADQLGDDLADADSERVTAICRGVRDGDWRYRYLPRMVTLELTPRREVTGPVTPQHHVTFDRPDLDVDLAKRLVEQIGDRDHGGDVTLLLGGLGDAMLHPDWQAIVKAAHEAGVFSVGIETDLLCEEDELWALLELPVDLVLTRFNADTAETYKQTMGADRFKRVLDNTQWLFNERMQRSEDPQAVRGAMPWQVPSMVKTVDTLPELESFFDKWSHYMGQAVVAPSCTGCGLMPAMSPVPMTPPGRSACLQLTRRMTILSDGTVARCDQDWLARAPIGDTRMQTLIDIWRASKSLAEAHAAQRLSELTICGDCVEWHRP